MAAAFNFAYHNNLRRAISISIVLIGFIAIAVESQPQVPRHQTRLLASPPSDRQLRKKCNREIQFCTRQNIDVFGLFVQTVLSIDLKRVNNEEAHQITENLCITFRPIFECIDRRNASWCSVPIGQQPNKLFHISYFVLVCELTRIWRECSVVSNAIEGGAQSNQATSVCSDHFPVLNREAQQLRLLTNPFGPTVNSKSASSGGVTMMADQPVPTSAAVASMEFILLNITESHCEEIMLFAGCQLHWTRSICGDKAYEIVRRLFTAYNDMSGKKCSGNHELQDVDFEVLERKYAERYLYLPASTEAPEKSVSKKEEESTSLAPGANADKDLMMPETPQTQATREAVDSLLFDDQVTQNKEVVVEKSLAGENNPPPSGKQQLEVSISNSPPSVPSTGPLNSSATRHLSSSFCALTLMASSLKKLAAAF